MTAETSNARWEVVAERQAWYEQQIALAEGQWAAAFLDRWECGDDVPSKEHYVALWLAERAAPPPAAESVQAEPKPEARGVPVADEAMTRRIMADFHANDPGDVWPPDEQGRLRRQALQDAINKNISAAPALAQQPEARGGGEVVAWMTPGGDVSRSFYWCLERCLPGQEEPQPLYAAPPSAPAGAAEDMVLDAIERRESRAPVGVKTLSEFMAEQEALHPGIHDKVQAATDELRASLAQQPAADAEWIKHPQTVEAKAQWDAVAQALGADGDDPDAVLAAARARQPAAVDESFVERFCGRWFQLTGRSLDRPTVRACFAEALAAQHQEPKP